MRNDVKLGFAIGGVLLAVLIVYVLVVPGGSSGNKQTSSASNGKVTLEPVGGGAATTQPSAPPAAPAATFTPQSPAAPSNDAVASKTDAPADASDPAKDAATAEASKSDTAAAAKAATGVPSNNKDIDWNKLLNEQPMAMAETPVAGSAKGHSAKVEAPAAPSSEGEVKPAVALAPVETPKSETLPQSNETTPAQPPAEKQIVETSPPADATSTGAGATTQPSSGTARTHQVHSGETLSIIAAAAYGNANLYPAIIRANPGIDPNHLKPGMILKLPDIKQVKPAVTSSALGTDADAKTASGHVAATPLTNKQYRVASGDNLYKISIKLYGKSTMAQKIYELNKQTIGEDSHKLKVGQVLELPEAPTVTASTR